MTIELQIEGVIQAIATLKDTVRQLAPKKHGLAQESYVKAAMQHGTGAASLLAV